jgi:hypothetical protein
VVNFILLVVIESGGRINLTSNAARDLGEALSACCLDKVPRKGNSGILQRAIGAADLLGNALLVGAGPGETREVSLLYLHVKVAKGPRTAACELIARRLMRGMEGGEEGSSLAAVCYLLSISMLMFY